jgi:hypothetical protein
MAKTNTFDSRGLCRQKGRPKRTNIVKIKKPDQRVVSTKTDCATGNHSAQSVSIPVELSPQICLKRLRKITKPYRKASLRALMLNQDFKTLNSRTKFWIEYRLQQYALVHYRHRWCFILIGFNETRNRCISREAGTGWGSDKMDTTYINNDNLRYCPVWYRSSTWLHFGRQKVINTKHYRPAKFHSTVHLYGI